jgi:gamma-glutamylcyclotransferase (GGCT)/AIG2-like uncharacterized protein YtfP
MASRCPFLFVYGRLRRGGSGNGLLREIGARPVADGTIAGRLYDLGDRPGLVRTRKAEERVRGEVYFLSNLQEDLRKIDKFHGFAPGNPARSPFVRKTVSVVADGGRSLEAWAYFYVRELKKSARFISTGDWLGRF